MAGHSKFKNIMYRKGAQDAKRSKIFSKLSREITVAAKQGGADPGTNARLRLAIQNARGQSMPKENIERAIKKADSGDLENYEEVRYEGYGPGGVALIVEALTDNRNRTAASLRSYFTKFGGALGETGSVSFLFDHLGEIVYPASAGTEEQILEHAMEAGAQDISSDEETHVITCRFEDLGEVARLLSQGGLGDATSVRAVWHPQNTTSLPEEKAQSFIKLMAILEEDDDVQEIFSTYEFSGEEFQQED